MQTYLFFLGWVHNQTNILKKKRGPSEIWSSYIQIDNINCPAVFIKNGLRAAQHKKPKETDER